MSAKGSTIEDMKDSRVPQCLFWTCEQVAEWVEQLGYPYYKDCFISNHVNGKKLIKIDMSSLPKIGITDFEHNKHIAKGVRKLLEIEDPYWNRSISLPPRESLGLYLITKSVNGQETDALTYSKFMMNFEEKKWQPPLSNHCLMLPHS